MAIIMCLLEIKIHQSFKLLGQNELDSYHKFSLIIIIELLNFLMLILVQVKIMYIAHHDILL